MHMADALLSPAVGASLWAVSGLTLGWCSKQLRTDPRDHLVPLMGVLGAFIFAAQMINFSIPGTGSSGHIGGGLLLSILLGGPAAFVVIASVLTVQALFFADGGLLALGANIFNLGIFPCFIAYPLIYRPLLKRAGSEPSKNQLTTMTVLAAVVSMQMGALGVVLETQMSGISSLPLVTFLWLMQPIHLAIGLVEGLATAAVIAFIRQARPDLLHAFTPALSAKAVASRFPTRVIVSLGCAALLTGGVFSWFASSSPDGLEWSIARVTGQPELASGASPIYKAIAQLQQRMAPLPGYKFAALENNTSVAAGGRSAGQQAWPAVDTQTSVAGVLGGVGTLVIVVGIGFFLRPRRARHQPHT
ncbi:energy-coupling factor ABC transporter permease [Rhodoferax sp.]|uniref:energy-coupling factor ABC transporter permease n=1 Tax=Rhodoferax sp. TaxID=50421 RepID=UPI0028523D19|nr:energy-coupling factor ABC transporter permease [Rhodoferax sp.]MDR3370910.1 energy-coupling factor ABC transporter permease [Rhodoferax sp.]